MTEKEFYKMHHKMIYKKGHPNSNKRGYIFKHRFETVEKIGRPLKSKEEIHHHYNWDGSVTLVLCPDKQYHFLLHTREEALRYCGHANWRKCVFCKKYDDPKNLSIVKWKTAYHKSCAVKYNRNRKSTQLYLKMLE